jgi:phosphatidylserine/phosphatidylglycerophosphate/cardiolipin synthase-like enzyme
MSVWLTASAATLRALAAALRSGQLAPPLSQFSLSKVAQCPPAVVEELQALTAQGMSAAHLALLLDTRADTAEARLAGASGCELVWTGPESIGSHCRDTAVVIEDIFSTATRSVLVSSYVVQGGDIVFRSLAARMGEKPDLQARMFLHVARKSNDTRDESELLREFASDLKREWPGQRRPEVFYDPRTMSPDRDVRASWHAKCVLADDEVAFVTSANFTEWAQQRNVEAGVLIRSAQFAKQLRHQFDGLVQSKLVRRLAGF